MRKTTLSLMITALVFSGAAIAGGQQDANSDAKAKAQAMEHSQAQTSVGTIHSLGMAKAFSRLDADADGMISPDEGKAMKGLPQQWNKLDTDGNGSLDVREFSALTENSSGTRSEDNGDEFARFEENSGNSPDVKASGSAKSDTKVEESDESGGNEADSDDSGDIRGQTLADASAKADARMSTNASVGGQDASSKLSVQQISQINVVQAFHEADGNSDRSVSKEEAKSIAGLEDEFDALDTNGDGKLDYAEFAAVVDMKGGAKS